MSTSEELYHIRSLFYSSQYEKVIETDFDTASKEAQEYILRSYLSLGKYDEVLSLAQENSKFQPFVYYVQYLQGDKNVVNDLLNSSKDLLSRILGSIVLVKEGDLEKALTFATDNLDLSNHDELNLEIYSIIVQIYILLGQVSQAKGFLKKFSKLNINDSIVYNYADSLVNLVQGGETSNQHVFYFFEEISHTNRSLKNFLYLLIIHLILNHFPESLQIVEQVDEIVDSDSSVVDNEHYFTYLINKAKILIINNDSDAAFQLINEQILTAKDQKHPFIVDYKEKEALFDEVVEKYSKQVASV